jgi:hypothetical protein
MTVDPSDPSVFWYTQEYYPVTANYDWHTRIAAFTFRDILDIKAIADYSEICTGQTDQLDVEVSGGNGDYTYSWTSIPAGFTSNLKNPVVSPDAVTKYIVNVTTGNQSRNDTVLISIAPLPYAYAGNDTTFCRQITEISLDGVAGTYVSMKWISSGDGTFADPNALLTSYTPGVKDRSDSLIDLELILYPQPPCPIVISHRLIHLVTCAGIPPISAGNEGILIFPNPGNGKFTLELPVNSLMLEITNIQGKIIMNADLSSFTGREFIVDLFDKPRGLYPVKILLDGRIIHEKIILK